MKKQIVLKVDVDTDRGTRIGVRNLLNLFEKHDIKATFLFSLGPDNTGRALKRVFQKGFFKKVSRTSVLKVYGIKTLLNGVLWPGPHIAKRNKDIMRQTHFDGHEVGVHTYDHIKWQNQMHGWDFETVRNEMLKAYQMFVTTFGFHPETFGAAGWQVNKHVLQVYEELHLRYASDTRGHIPFFPCVGPKKLQTLQIPTNLPTLDELLGRPEYPIDRLIHHYDECMMDNNLNVFTLHAELEGMAYLDWFETFLIHLKSTGVDFITLKESADQLLNSPDQIPTLELIQTTIDGRGGEVAAHC
ncbi:MAG: 4-deoxy-4-formamido-L-arabinose-phosphoundecaprenol deformylase [Candidatus Puniceispirillum sp.]|nr:4-deoxy-4-formamido-L-arabinose-phosphoundecaprenol deformylase [Candidatus Pelagibacter sp.]MBA4283406.1 4-deoxy-4-formamido-L-arabinose-phosphoundecaprenol deformylase [Candidatus Puniceispirillum sp.]